VLGPFGEEPREYTEAEISDHRTKPGLLLEKRKQIENITNSYFAICIKGSEAQAQIQAFLKSELKRKVTKPELWDILIPTYGVGCRRPPSGVQYLERLSASNVEVVLGDIKDVTNTEVIDKRGTKYPLDVLICATGFDTSYKPRFPIVGANGTNLQDEWADHARAYMATAVAGFPNYFLFCGPNNPFASGAYLSTVGRCQSLQVLRITHNYIECQADYMLKFCVRWQSENIVSFAPKVEAVNDFLEHTARVVQKTVWVDDCRSWYKKHTTDPSNLLLWPGSGLHFMEAMSEVRFDDFDITYRGNRFAWLGDGFSQTEVDPTSDKAYYIREADDSPLLGRSRRRKAMTRNEKGTSGNGMAGFGVGV